LVVACNTASAVALPALVERCPVPAWGVIDPGVEAATRVTRSGGVGVIGTQAAMASRAYQRRLEARGFQVWARACPMLVHVVEEGLAESPEAGMLVRHYLSGRPPIDTLILGCTHYPLLRNVIQRAVDEDVTLVDSAEATAEVVSRALEREPHPAARPLRPGAPPRCRRSPDLGAPSGRSDPAGPKPWTSMKQKRGLSWGTSIIARRMAWGVHNGSR